MNYTYRVRDGSGRILRGTMKAENRNSVIQALLHQDYTILEIREHESKEAGPREVFSFNWFQPIKIKDLSLFTRQLSVMVGAGLPIVRSFKILEEQTQNARLCKIAGQIREDLEAGLSLHEALERHSQIFSPMYVSMVKAGETGGALDAVLQRLADTLEREQEINAKIKSASVYPVMVLSIAVLVVIFILMFVMPIFVQSYLTAGTELPAFTQFFLNISYFLKEHFLLLFGGVTALVFALKAWGRTPNGRLLFDRLYLQIPLVGKVVNRVAVSRFTRILGTLIRSGVPILQAMEVLQGVVGNRVIGDAIGKVRESIREGQPIAAPLAATGVFEPMVTQMIAVGEETGALDSVLERISVFYDQEVTLAIEALLKSLEPIMVIFVAIIIGMIIVATYLPIFNILSTIYV